MERIRIGNNIGIVWHIFVADELGESFVLEDKKDSLKVFLRSPYNIVQVENFGVNGDTITFSFKGSEQKYVGVYAVVLKDSTDGERTLCEDFAFELVKHISKEPSETEENYTKQILSLNSSILVSKQGESAYEVWLRMGNKGTEEDFFNWLRGGTLVNYSFKSPLVSTLAPDGVNYIVSLNENAINGLYISDGTITEEKFAPELQQFIYNAVSKQRLQELFDTVVIDEGRFKTITTDNLVLNGHSFTGIADDSTDPQSTTAIVTPSYIKDYGFGSFLSRKVDDTAHGLITFENGFIVGANLFNEAITEERWHLGTTDTQIMSAAAIRRLITDNIASLPNKYLRKDIEDTAKEMITFDRGISSNDISFFYAGMYAAGVATFKNILSSETFVSGWSPIGKGWKLWVEEYENIAGAPDFRTKMEIDELTVRGTFRVFEFVINQLRGENDNYVFAAMMKVESFEAPNIIWLDTNKGETYNPFRYDDVLRCQQFRGNKIKQYTLIVDEVVLGDISDGEERRDYITFKKFDGSVDEEGLPVDIEQGDVLVRLDNLTDPDRKGIVSVNSIGDGSPNISVSYGTITNPDNSLRVRLGKLDGIIDKLHGALSNYGLYGNRAYLTGEFNLVTGEDVRTQFLAQENLLCSRQSKITYDLTDSEMLIRNCAFTDNLEFWEKDVHEVDGMYSIDGIPLMHDYGILSNYEHDISIQKYLGKEILRILDSGITQKQTTFAERIPEDYEVEEYIRYEEDILDEEGNVIHEKDEIQLNEDGSPKTKTIIKRNTFHLYISYMCNAAPTSGTAKIRFGFNTGRIYVRQDTDGDVVTIPPLEEQEDDYTDLCLVEETAIPYDDKWIERHYIGCYDGTSDFRIETEGDFCITNFILTNHPLDEFKNVITTALLQHDGIIGLYGQNIKKGGEETANLKVEVDANKEQISAIGTWDDKNKSFTLSNGLLINREGSKLFSSYLDEQEQKISSLKVSIEGITADVYTVRGGQYELQYLNTVYVRTNSVFTIQSSLSYFVGITSLFAGIVVDNYSISIANDSQYNSTRGYGLTLNGTSGVYVVCDSGKTLSQSKALEVVVTIQDPDGKRVDQTDPSSPIRTYLRSAFITLVPNAKGANGTDGDKGDKGDKGDTGDTGAGEVYTLVDLGSFAQVNAKNGSLAIYATLSCTITHTIDGTVQNIDSTFISSHRLRITYNGNTSVNKTINLSTGNITDVILNWVTYTDSDEGKGIVVSLENISSNTQISSFTIPLQFTKGGTWQVTENGINGYVSDNYGSFSEFLMDAQSIMTEVKDARGSSSLKQTFDAIESTVAKRGNPNLLTAADGSGWLTFIGGNSVEFDAETQKVYGSSDIASPMVYLLAGNSYCFSWYAEKGTAARVYYSQTSSDWSTSNKFLSPKVEVVDIEEPTPPEWSEPNISFSPDVIIVYDFTLNDNDEPVYYYKFYYRRHVTFIAPVSGWYRVNIWGFGTQIYRPKMETGTTPTLYDSTIQSAIKQTAETITLTAKNINLEGLVTANSNFKILTDGSMEAVNAKFSGEITATSGTVGGWQINEDSIGVIPDDHSVGTYISKDAIQIDNGNWNTASYICQRLTKDSVRLGGTILLNASLARDPFMAEGMILMGLPSSAQFANQLYKDSDGFVRIK